MADGTLIQEQDIENVPSMRRNPIIAEIFHRLDYTERRGSGFKKICTETANLYGYTDEYAPQFPSTPSAFHVIFKNMNYGRDIAQQVVADKVTDKVTDKLVEPLALLTLTSGEKAFLEALIPYFQENEWVTNTTVREVTHAAEDSAKRYLGNLTEKGIFEAQGEKKSRQYQLTPTRFRMNHKK